jgi:DNA-3-methyladenine glycosylase II
MDKTWENIIHDVGDCLLKKTDSLLPHQSLVKAIFFQQLHPKAGNAIFNRFVENFSQTFPDDEIILNHQAKLSSIGLSSRKIKTIIDIVEANQAQLIPSKSQMKNLSNDEIIAEFTKIKGIGRWSVEMMLIFNQQHLDIMPSSDYAIRKNYSQLFGYPSLLTPNQITSHTRKLSPYRSIAAWYIWNS